ncbi:hypothetical protein PybrP1_012289 [[Pythium] brassicae (nom. inval.)]|nr:hypothetical protein PybrP1_012289 [[Pythium] brassicae (nom. inval.)]
MAEDHELAERRRRLEKLLRDLRVDAGDSVVFDRDCTRMSAYGAAICAGAKLWGRTPWDHNGVVIRSPAADGELFLLEATLTGVKLRPLVERLTRSQSHDVAVRRLQVHRSDAFVARAWDFAHAVLDSPYETRPQRMFNAGVKVPTREERERLFDLVVTKKKELATLESDLEHRLRMPAFERNALLAERARVLAHYHALVAQLRQKERSVFENERIAQPHARTTMFCSQLVAGLYQHLGLLLPYPSANSYLPQHFADDDSERYLKLQQGATFLPAVSLRRRLDANYAAQRARAREAADRAPQSPDEVAGIVRCLRRHQLFHALSESELVAIAARFRRRALADGEVVFYQGMPGDFFYIIEQGECDVFVDYDHLRRTQEGDEAQSNPSDDARSVRLQRRKTLSLPDFHDGASAVSERVHVATNGPGRAFGESALIYDTPRRATLRAVAGPPSAVSTEGASSPSPGVVLWALDKQTFKAVVEAHPASQHSMEERQFLMKAISDHPLFSELDERAKAMAVRKLFPLRVRAGTTVLRQGDSGDYFYIIESGTCEIARRKPGCAAPFVDRVIGRGASFGEAALLYNSRRGATVSAREDTRVWCMDRASFLTITRSGSAALLKLFRRVSSHKPQDSTETFVTQPDLERMLAAPANAHALARQPSDVAGNEPRSGPDEPALLPAKAAYDRAVRLGVALLFHDASGVINFSQFAHFHITLGARNIEQLLPEAAFRIVKALSGGAGSGSREGAVTLAELQAAIRDWAGVDQRDPLLPASAYDQLFDVKTSRAGEHLVTQDDVARAIAALADLELADDAAEPFPAATQQAHDELRAFVAALTRDIGALRTIWHAAELQQAGAGAADDVNRGKSELTFDADLQSGWLSAVRHNPTGGDWEYPQASLADVAADDEASVDAAVRARRRWQQLASFAAAIGAGALARTVCAPLERLKILIQLPAPTSVLQMGVASPYRSLARGLVNMVKLSGARSLFSGNLTHCLWLIPSLPTQFLLCDVYRTQLSRLLPPPTSDAPGTRRTMHADAFNLLAGGLAGLTANTLLYPLDVVRGRLSVQQFYGAEKQFAGIRDVVRATYRTEGARALYRGFAPASAGVFAYIGCNYSIYEFLRPSFVRYDTDSASGQLAHPSVPGQILCATTASLAAQALSYPFDVVRRRMQLQGAWHAQLAFPNYSSSWACVRATARERALYRGLLVNAVKALPSAVISFVSYEKLRAMQARAGAAYEA